MLLYIIYMMHDNTIKTLRTNMSNLCDSIKYEVREQSMWVAG